MTITRTFFVSEDYGQTWKSLRSNLPMGTTRVLREDPKNPDLLYLGTEFFDLCVDQPWSVMDEVKQQPSDGGDSRNCDPSRGCRNCGRHTWGEACGFWTLVRYNRSRLK